MSLIKSVKGIPDPFATFEEKKSDEYGLKISQLISGEWFGGKTISAGCEFMNRREYVRQKRLFVRGEQDTKQFKDHQSRGDNDINLLNLDWSIINLAKKFCRLVSNGIADDKYRLDVHASDKLSVKLKEMKMDGYRKDMASMPMLNRAKDVLGIDLTAKGFVPEDEDEMRLFMEIKDRPKIEICEEILIDYVKQTNDWDFIEGQKNVDLVDLGIAGVRIYTDKNDGVKLAYVDPENYIHSRVSRNDFADKHYEGVVDTITLSDLRRESDFSEVELRQIAKAYSVRNKATFGYNFDTCPMDAIIDYQLDVLRFAWKTSKEIVFKKKVRKGQIVKVSRKSDSFLAPEREDTGRLSKKLDTWFEGNHIIGTNAIYGYQECENLARDTMNKAMSPFVVRATDIYENRLRSFLSDIEPIVTQMQNISLKTQHLIAELKPDLIKINLDQLAELDDGKGGAKREKWQTALTLMGVKGVVFEKTIDLGDAGGVQKGSAVTPASSQQGSAIGILMNAWAFEYNKIRDISGINPARDGSLPADALVGVNQMAQLASNTATQHIVEASIAFNKKVCEVISTRIHGVFKHKEAEHLKEIYVNAVGKHLFDAMEVMADRHLHEFGFYFQMLPTNQELADFREDLNLALQQGNLLAEVKSQAEEIAKSNIKLAREYLFFHARKRMKQSQDEQMMLAKNKSENDSAAAQAKVAAEIQGYGQKKQIDLGYASQLAQIEIQKAQALQEIAQPVADKQFQQDVYIQKIKGAADFNMKNFLEDRKDDRTKIQAGQQSKMKQASEFDAPIDFQNEFSIDQLL